MGYLITMTDSNFTIKKENYDKALASLKAVFVPENMTCYDSIGGVKYPHFSWVNTEDVLNSDTLQNALEEIRYIALFNSDGNIQNVEFTGEKYGDEKIFFGALAPYVESDSYIEFKGEDGAMWRWVFRDGNVKNIDLGVDKNE